MGTPSVAPPNPVLLWAPRILAVGVSLFLAIFALDAFDTNSFTQALPDFLMHLLPSVFLLTIVAVAWRHESIGAVAFTVLAVGYAVAAREHPSWIAVIAGPLLAVGALYGWNWRRRSQRAV